MLVMLLCKNIDLDSVSFGCTERFSSRILVSNKMVANFVSEMRFHNDPLAYVINVYTSTILKFTRLTPAEERFWI